MRWRSARRSDNVEDRRGRGRMPGGMKAAGGIGAVLIALVAGWLGMDKGRLQQLLDGLGLKGGGQAQQQAPGQEPKFSKEEQELADFVKVVLGYTEDIWKTQFRTIGKTYEEPQLVLFTGSTMSACGEGQAAMGPFYCPADRKVYIDLTFYNDLKQRHGAPGDFAQAYVIAHEVGHHIQKLLGQSDYVNSKRGKVSKTEQNELSVRLELQADFLAGVWAHHAQKHFNFLEEGDIEEALRAAHAIGDDTLQKRARGYATPHTFTHGTSEQRVRWFTKGFQTGDMRQGDTFKVRNL